MKVISQVQKYIDKWVPFNKNTRCAVRCMAELWIESIGLIAGALGIVAWIPQIKEVWVHKKHDGISLTTTFDENAHVLRKEAVFDHKKRCI